MRRAMHTARGCRPGLACAPLGRQPQHGGDHGLDSDGPGLGLWVSCPLLAAGWYGRPGTRAPGWELWRYERHLCRPPRRFGLCPPDGRPGPGGGPEPERAGPSAVIVGFQYVQFATPSDGWAMADE